MVVDVPQDLLFINVDGKLMVQVFINILNNAIKYTKEKINYDSCKEIRR